MTSGTFEWRLPGDQGVETQSLMDQLMMATDQPDCWTRVLEHLARQVDVSPKQLVDWYDRAIASIPTSINRKNPQYAILCLDWALAYRNHEGVEEGLLKMKWIAANKVGVDLARTWIQRAQFEFEVGHHDKARKYVLEGIAKKAQPEHALEEFLVKVTNHTLEAKEFLCFPPLKDSASTPFTTGTVSSNVSSSSASSKSSKRSSCTMVEMMESQDNVIRSTKPSLVSVLDKENIIAPSRSNFKSNGQRKPLQAKPMGSTNSKPDEHRKVLFKKPSEDETKVKKSFFVHGKKYIVKEQVGKGGSGTVFKVYDDDLEVFALKKVKLDASDDKRMESLRNEISLLEKLRAKPQIIQLYSWEIDEESEHLLMVTNPMSSFLRLQVFEYGQTDLAKLLKKKKNFSLNYVRTLWEQMLQAVQTIHEERIVHGDLVSLKLCQRKSDPCRNLPIFSLSEKS